MVMVGVVSVAVMPSMAEVRSSMLAGWGLGEGGLV
jgi:hypothetical protein